MNGHQFTADPHFGHKLVAKLRGFNNVEDHDQWLLDRINNKVTPDTILWILGDLGVSTSNYVINQVRKINCRRVLIAGNHDAFHPMHRNAWKQQIKHPDLFEAVLPYQKLKVNGTEILMNHLPYEGDHTGEERYAQYRMPDRGMSLLCGHVHDAWRFKGNQFNVGVDVNDFKPVTWETIAGWLDFLEETV